MNAPGAARVLVADDEHSIRFVLRETLEAAGHQVVDVDSGDAALAELAGGDFAIAFFDIRMPGAGGLELLDHLKGMGSDVAVVIITAQNTFENAVEAMKRGALDYLVKPFATGQIAPLVEKALRIRALAREVRELRREVSGAAPKERMVGFCPAMLEVFKTVGRVSRSDVPVLIFGESGTGKELIARAIHFASTRAEAPFVAVNAAAIPRELLESELFGHERGAFTGAVEARPGRFREASGGTLFLDEIGDMPIELQAKLLRVLQSGELTPVGGRRPESVDVRILAATHRDLDQAVAAGGFRQDLLYRLNVVPITVPPLRERREDVEPLALHFLARYDRELTGGAHALSERALARLAAHNWPGNVRELENAIKRALVLAGGEMLSPEDFHFLDSAEREEEAEFERALVREVRAALESGERGPGGSLYRELLARFERPLFQAALAHTGGNQLRAAALLGINRNTLHKKLGELGVPGARRGADGANSPNGANGAGEVQ
ncbi:MAG: sigma-54 dependent transcriptional regulator [Deltaproteobacteria bacterium]|nr:sigma-54 dependent transcriptional regulator [Deltaproteobacteria bacterium]